jgi:predicted  nucleic acid-binding Zn-ribbon protein
MPSRRLPQTTTIVQNENAALKNRAKYLEESLNQSHTEANNLREIIKNLKKEIEKLKKEKAEVEEILQYREEFIEDHCA